MSKFLMWEDKMVKKLIKEMLSIESGTEHFWQARASMVAAGVSCLVFSLLMGLALIVSKTEIISKSKIETSVQWFMGLNAGWSIAIEIMVVMFLFGIWFAPLILGEQTEKKVKKFLAKLSPTECKKAKDIHRVLGYWPLELFR